MNVSDVIERIGRSATVALLVSPAGLLVLSVTRLLIVSNYNSATASAIASSQGYINTLLGTVIPIIPIIMPYLALLLLYSARVIAGMLALLATALISPPSMSRSQVLITAKKDWHWISAGTGTRHDLLVILVIPLASLLVIELVGFDFITFLRTLGTAASIALIAVIVRLYPLPLNNSVYISPITQPWLPAEIMTLTSHQQIVGYVLSSDGYWLEVLMADSREVKHYYTSEILEREICQMNKPSQNRPLLSLMSVPAPTPQCPRPTVVVKEAPSWLLPFLGMQGGAGGVGNTCIPPAPAACQQSSRKLDK
jgi:hypothetical protein